ncbi:PNPOx family protein [Lapidilactobacillus bayanensis]|uniref:flavin reductase family protein n=1 Tax=Lapidilactobacillus bayanensis TaxID=2485998 RepID=UPI000F7AFD5A|nr:flavin reductase family protein [Lapidilactobacillus bayanensis]
MKVINTSKLYYGFPIFVLGYPDAQNQYNITTCSSSYSLGSMVQFGLGADTNAATQISHYQRCTLNLLPEEALQVVEKAGFRHARAKLNATIPYHIDQQTDLPVIDQALLTLYLRIDFERVYQGYANFTAHIEKREVRDDLIVDGKLQSASFNPVLYVGDEHERKYRFLSDRSEKLGSFLRKERPRTKRP